MRKINKIPCNDIIRLNGLGTLVLQTILKVFEASIFDGTHNIIVPHAAHGQYIANIPEFFTLCAVITFSQNIPKIRNGMKRNISLHLPVRT
jgi:hypothetical protein